MRLDIKKTGFWYVVSTTFELPASQVVDMYLAYHKIHDMNGGPLRSMINRTFVELIAEVDGDEYKVVDIDNVRAAIEAYHKQHGRPCVIEFQLNNRELQNIAKLAEIARHPEVYCQFMELVKENSARHQELKSAQ